MWEQYRKTLPVMQGFILIFCLVLFFVVKLPLPAVLLILLVMELGAVLGAWWGARLKGKIIAGRDTLPLRNKL